MASEIIFSNNFNQGKPNDFTGAGKIESVKGYAGIGPSGNQFSGNFLRSINNSKPQQPVILTLTNLPKHTSINIDFLWAAIDSWDGQYAPRHPQSMPDFFNVTVDGKKIFKEAFDNVNTYDVGYPNQPHPVDQTYTRSSPIFLGHGKWKGNDKFSDSAYNLGRDGKIFDSISHTGKKLVIKWFASGSGWQGGSDESWAIDNVKITLNGVTNQKATVDSLTGKLGVLNSEDVLNLGSTSKKEPISPIVLDKEESSLRTLNNVETTMMPNLIETWLAVDNSPIPVHQSVNII